MSFPVYTLAVRPPRTPRYSRDAARGRMRGARDPGRAPKVCIPTVKVPVYRVVLRKERTIRVREVRVSNREQAVSVAHHLIGDSPYEKMLAILIDSQGAVVGAVLIATSSTISSMAISVRGIFSAAIAHNASAVILAHNHPSGIPTPSDEDRETTRKSLEASRILGIPVLDHVIVTRDPDVWSYVMC